MPILSTKDKKGNTTLNVVMGDGISTITKGMPVCITLTDKNLHIKQRFSKNVSITLKCSQVTNIQEIYGEELIVYNKDGSRKAIEYKSSCRSSNVKAGARTKKGLPYKDFIVINYGSTSKKAIVFEKIVGTTLGSEEFIKEIQQRANIIA